VDIVDRPLEASGSGMTESYSRLYHRFAVEFPEVYSNDSSLATWVRLLLLADASWPMRPPLPRSAKMRHVQHLAMAGLIEIVGDEEYTVRGLDAERTRRRDAGRTGAAKRWQSERNANASADAMPRRDETRQAEDEKEIPPPPAERGRRSNATNPRATGSAPRSNGANPRANGTSPRQEIKRQKRAPASPSVAAILRAANEGRVA
jgi:hypothetical protein